MSSEQPAAEATDVGKQTLEEDKAKKDKSKEEDKETTEIVEQALPVVVPEGHHGLHSVWTFWFDKKPTKQKQTWEENLVDLGSFSTVEGFYSIYSHLQRPSSLSKDGSYHCFRNHVQPMWESFPHGGCWILSVKKRSGLLNRMWEELLLAAIGEAFEDPDVVGVGVSIRQKLDRISIWNRDNSNQNIRFMIGEKLKAFLTLDSETNQTIEYKNNATSIKDRSTFRNAKTYQFVVAHSGAGDAKDDEEVIQQL